jgi:hypothetical protein
METRITMQAKNQFEKHTKDPIEKLWTVLDTRAKKFDGKTNIFDIVFSMVCTIE